MVPHYLASEGVANLLLTARRLRSRFGHESSLLGIVLTMVDYRTRACRDNVDAIRSQYRDGVFAIEIRVNTRLAEAPGAGKTIFEYDGTATGARAYRLLAAETLIRVTSRRRLEAPAGPDDGPVARPAAASLGNSPG